MIGQILSHYRILEVLGSGGMGVVYRAHDERLDRDVALKVLSQASVGDGTARKRLRREALLLSKLSHPHICTIFDFDSQDGVDFLVMELVSGESLAARLRRGALSESEVLPIGIQIAEALDEAHRQSVVHRDLKPGNVMIMTRGTVKVLDFGIARSVEQESMTVDNLTGTGMIAGTLPYMAPELFRGSDADARTDIYAWGAVAYELATGVRPFAQNTPASLVQAILNDPPTPPTMLVPELSPGFEEVILKALQKDREARHASAGEVVAALTGMGNARSAAAPRRAARARWPLAASMVGAFLLAIVLFLSARSWKMPFGAPPGIQSLAVLPLANLSGDPSQDYFADGMTDALITRLAQIHDLRVISRTSVDRYRKTMKSVPEIGRELHVQAVVEGSVLRSGDRVRITAQLVDASKDQHLWANDYERDLSDVIALQSDLVGAIASQIQARLTPGERAGLAHIDVVKSDAYDDYLKGRYHSNRRTKEDLEAARALFQRAIESDPGFALAHAGLADTYILLHLYAGMSSTEAFPLAMGAARKALDLNEDLAEAYPAIALVKIYSKWDWDGAESDFKRGIRLKPSYATAYHWYSILLRDRGRFDESIAAARHALELDPLSLIVNANLGDAYFFARRYDDAIRQHRAGRDLDPGFPPTHLYLGMAFAQKGQIDSALTECRTARALAGHGDFGLGGLGYVLARAGRNAEATDVLRKLEDDARGGAAVSFDIGLVQVGLGNRAQAIEWLGRACQDQPSGIKDLGVDPRLDPLRKEAGFRELLRRTRLDQNRM
ncbi:MAG TPA: protein kinase [Candidatus Eisenbacteria bacterium]|jgi:serine/threonine-protein kinase|nr:protein kinase [Candidatus Eisenbacteria bacterium]